MAGRPRKGSGYVRRHPYHTNKVGDLTQVIREYTDSVKNKTFHLGNRQKSWNRWKANRAELLAGISFMVWEARQNVAEAIASDFAPMVLGPLVEQAQSNVHEDYLKFMAAEPQGAANPWTQEDPSESEAFKYGKAQVNGQEMDIRWSHGESRAVTFEGNKFNTFAMSKIRFRFNAIDRSLLDKTLDRTAKQSVTVQVAVPLAQRKKGARGALAKGAYVRIITLNIHGRSSRSRDPRTGGPWNLWRAMEYGQVAGRHKRVMVRNIESFRTVDDYEDTEREGSVVAYAESIEASAEWYVFMSPQWKWWSRQSVKINGQLLIEVDQSNNYMAGTAPIRRAIMRGAGDADMHRLLGACLDGAMVKAGFRRG